MEKYLYKLVVYYDECSNSHEFYNTKKYSEEEFEKIIGGIVNKIARTPHNCEKKMDLMLECMKKEYGFVPADSIKSGFFLEDFMTSR